MLILSTFGLRYFGYGGLRNGGLGQEELTGTALAQLTSMQAMAKHQTKEQSQKKALYEIKTALKSNSSVGGILSMIFDLFEPDRHTDSLFLYAHANIHLQHH